MTIARHCSTLLLCAAALTFAKSSPDAATICDRFQQSDLVFTGTADSTWVTMVNTLRSPIHKRSEKSKRIEFLAREWFKGQRSDTVIVWMTPSNCDLRVEADHTYLIYAHLNKENGRIESNGCMGTTLVSNAVSDLSYLAAAQRGAAYATRISGNAGNPGVNIEAKSGINIRYAVSDSSGHFAFDGLPAGAWNLSVSGATPKHVDLAPASCLNVDLP